MTTVTKLKPDAEEAALRDPLAILRDPFPDNLISKLPKPTKAQTEAVKANFKSGIRCKACGAWHHPDVVHLDYVGHAALTHRLLDVDPHWSWEPVAFRDGLPAFDQTGGLWIRLTICGVTRLGYGHAAPKTNQDPGSREKEVIGDALRNAAMRFGAALDLWHKGDLHVGDNGNGEPTPSAEERAIAHLQACSVSRQTFKDAWESNKAAWKGVLDDAGYARVVTEMKRLGSAIPEDEPAEPPPPDDNDPFNDEIPF